MSAQEKMFLNELADLVERFGATFRYTTGDDGIHVCLNDGDDIFIGFDLEPAELRAAAAT